MRRFPQWRWHLDEVFVKINGKFCYLWRAVDHEGEVLETVVTAKRDKAAALKFLKRIMKKYGRPRNIVTDGLSSYPAAMKEALCSPTQNVWPAPSASDFVEWAVFSLLQRIRPRAPVPGQDGDTRVLILIRTAASSAISTLRGSGRRSTVRPSRFHHSQTSSTDRCAQALIDQ
jgi:hypothetical protein